MEKLEDINVQREETLELALQLLERNGLANTTLDMLAEETALSAEELRRFWPDREALLYDALRYHSQQLEVWRRQVFHDEDMTPQQKLMARYEGLTSCVSNQRYPGCLFVAACSFFPEATHPIHQLSNQQKRAAWEFTHGLLLQLEVDNPAMVAEQMELVLEGCLSRLLIKRSQADVDTARRLAEDILRFACCRTAGAFA